MDRLENQILPSANYAVTVKILNLVSPLLSAVFQYENAADGIRSLTLCYIVLLTSKHRSVSRHDPVLEDLDPGRLPEIAFTYSSGRHRTTHLTLYSSFPVAKPDFLFAQLQDWGITPAAALPSHELCKLTKQATSCDLVDHSLLSGQISNA